MTTDDPHRFQMQMMTVDVERPPTLSPRRHMRSPQTNPQISRLRPRSGGASGGATSKLFLIGLGTSFRREHCSDTILRVISCPVRCRSHVSVPREEV